MISLQILATLLLVSESLALYDESPDVVKLTPDNFDKLVTNSSEVWIVMFYAPWCGWSKIAVPEYTKAACALKGIAKLGALDADQHYDFGSNYGVEGYPTIRVFAGGKHERYKDKRNAKMYVEAVFKAANKQATDNLSQGACKLLGDESSEEEDVETTTQDVESTTQDVETTTQDVETTTQDNVESTTDTDDNTHN